MNNTVDQLIKELNLIAHPEGGYYSETYRSDITLEDSNRQLTTAIYFLLPSGHVSHFHRIKSDELWFFHGGSPLTVHTLDENGHHEHSVGLDVLNGQTPQLLVKGNTIFGSSVDDENSYSLVSCVVSPGFDFNDFELFTTEDLLPQFPEFREIIERLT